MHRLTRLIQEDMKPALGVTEPGAIALAVSKAVQDVPGEIKTVSVRMNSGMLKNAWTCGIPNSTQFGVLYAAALGAVAGKPEKGLFCLEDVSACDNEKAGALVKAGKISCSMTEISSRIFIEAAVQTETGTASVQIQDSHTNVVREVRNGEVLFSKTNIDAKSDTQIDTRTESKQNRTQETVSKTAVKRVPEMKMAAGEGIDAEIHSYTLQELWDYAISVPLEELTFLEQAHEMNFRLCEAGAASERTTFSHFLYKKNGGAYFSKEEQRTSELLCGAAIEARVLGLPLPAMSVTGSGAHGILATMPLYAAYRVHGYTKEKLLRATALSCLVCMYIKEYSGKLSAFCGCAIAAGCGAACGLTLLSGFGEDALALAIRNIASSITGMICDGGNQGCVLKGITAADAAYEAAELAKAGIAVDAIHGINGESPEETMQNMGRIASPGMVHTEQTILDIVQEKENAARKMQSHTQCAKKHACCG